MLLDKEMALNLSLSDKYKYFSKAIITLLILAQMMNVKCNIYFLPYFRLSLITLTWFLDVWG